MTTKRRSRSQSSEAERREGPRRAEDRRLQQRNRELEAARLVCQAIFQEIDANKLVERALHIALEVVGAEAGSVLLADPKKEQLCFSHVSGEKADQLRGMGFPWDKGLAGSVFKSGEPAIVADAKKDGRHYPNIDQLTGFRTRDMIVMPLKQWGHPPIGVLEVMNKRDGCLDEGDVALLTVVSALTTAAVEQARLFEQAKLAEVGHRLADIGHDVNNLLTPVGYGLSRIKADLDRLSESPAGCDVREMLAALQVSKKTLNTVELTVRRVQDRMKQVMDCVQDVKTPPRLTPCCLGTILSEVTRVLGNVAAVTGVMLRVEGVDTLPSILGDERRLFSLFYNLVDNALAEVPPGGAVTVRGKLDSGDKALLLSVIDTGRGMAKDVLESLFSDHTISRKIGGTGLGSKIVKDAVDAHGGRISVESTQGVGTTFLIQLPINPPGPPTQ